MIDRADASTDYFANHARARQFPWTLYHAPLERDLERWLRGGSPDDTLLVVGCGLLHEIDAAPPGLRFHVADIDERAVAAVLAKRDPRIVAGHVVRPETRIELGRTFDGIYAKEVIEHVVAWPDWLVGLRRALRPGGRLWLSTPNYGEPWLPAIESTVLEWIARRSGFSRRDIHPTRFSRRSLERGLRAAGFIDIETAIPPPRFAIAAHARAPQGSS